VVILNSVISHSLTLNASEVFVSVLVSSNMHKAYEPTVSLMGCDRAEEKMTLSSTQTAHLLLSWEMSSVS
jgi:hypothetical protein